jgi:hypothetical protein
VDPSPQPAAPAEFEAIEAALSGMVIGSIAFNVPSRIPVGESVTVQLLLSPSATETELKALIETGGTIETHRVRISGEMEARLVGESFTITSVHASPRQLPNRLEPTEWRWTITPTMDGPRRRTLHLTLPAIVIGRAGEVPYSVRTLEKVIEVEVTWSRRVSSFSAGNWQWLWATIAVPAAGAIFQMRRRGQLGEDKNKDRR